MSRHARGLRGRTNELVVEQRVTDNIVIAGAIVTVQLVERLYNGVAKYTRRLGLRFRLFCP